MPILSRRWVLVGISVLGFFLIYRFVISQFFFEPAPREEIQYERPSYYIYQAVKDPVKEAYKSLKGLAAGNVQETALQKLTLKVQIIQHWSDREEGKPLAFDIAKVEASPCSYSEAQTVLNLSREWKKMMEGKTFTATSFADPKDPRKPNPALVHFLRIFMRETPLSCP